MVRVAQRWLQCKVTRLILGKGYDAFRIGVQLGVFYVLGRWLGRRVSPDGLSGEDCLERGSRLRILVLRDGFIVRVYGLKSGISDLGEAV